MSTRRPDSTSACRPTTRTAGEPRRGAATVLDRHGRLRVLAQGHAGPWAARWLPSCCSRVAPGSTTTRSRSPTRYRPATSSSMSCSAISSRRVLSRLAHRACWPGSACEHRRESRNGSSPRAFSPSSREAEAGSSSSASPTACASRRPAKSLGSACAPPCSGEREPDPRTAVLATLASACGLVDLHVPRDARRAAAQRVAGFAADDALPDAVADAIEAAERATAGAVLGAQSAIHTS